MTSNFNWSPEVEPNLVLYSGGMDSFITLKYVDEFMTYYKGERLLVYCGMRHRYEEQERTAIWDTVGDGKVIFDTTLRGLGMLERADAFIPARNGHLILAALRYLPSVSTSAAIWLTVQQDEMTLADRSAKFLNAMSEVGSILKGYPVTVTSPWIAMDKTDMVSWYLQRGYSAKELLATWSCYSSESYIPCGDCSACLRRYIALQLNGLGENYCRDPRTSATAARYRDMARKGAYSAKRRKRILEALGD